LRSVAERYRGSRVRVFALDCQSIIAALRARAARLVAEDPDVIEVRLFGSLAAGQAKPGSDADIWILLERSSLSFVERTASFGKSFAGVA
jgi:predicted nucleotidyltransferase